ncbi:MAG: hypothetical protein R3A13_12840 [Bdellovibrionota bacterium]
MSETPSLESFYHYLCSVKTDYPYGIPAALFEEQAVTLEPELSCLWGNGQVGVCFLAEFPPWKNHPFDSEEGRLLHAAISKGMKIMPEHVSIIDVNKLDSQDVFSVLKNIVPEVILVLGKEVLKSLPEFKLSKFGETAEYDETLIILAPALSQVLTSPDNKRKLWSSLKTALRRMGINA